MAAEESVKVDAPFDGVRPRRVKQIIAISFGVVLLALITTVFFLPKRLAFKGVHTWNLFHYMLGSKYFDEVGYYDLYLAVILADAEDQRVLVRHRSTRDLRTYRHISMHQALQQARTRRIRQRFTAARWREFRRDVRALLRQRGWRFWGEPINDRGFNPSPAWVLFHKPLLNLVEFQSDRVVLLLSYLQAPLFLLTFLGVWWAFGWKITIPFVLFTYCYFGNGIRILGGYFSYDWFFLTTWSVVLYRRGHYLAAAPLLAYAAMVRGYPGLVALFPAVAMVSRLFRLRRPERRHLVFLASLGASCLLIFGLSLLQKGGFTKWSHWKDKITLHAQQHELSSPRVGLRLIFAHDYRTGKWDIPEQQRQQVIKRNRPAYYAAATAIGLLLLLAMIRRDDHDGLLLGLGVVFVTVLVSRYYWTTAALLMTWTALDRRRIVNWISTGWLFGLLLLFATQWFCWRANMRLRWHTFSWGLLLYFVSISAYFLVLDVRWLRQRWRER